MKLDQLQLFIRIAATQNISAAGAELGLSPAVASAHLSQLEQSLGARLLHRTTRKVSLTEEGQAFIDHAQDVLASAEAAKAAVGASSHSPTGTLRVAAPASFGRMHLVPALKDFNSQYPNLAIDLRLSDTIIDMVEGGFDVAIRNSGLKDSSLIARKLADDRRLLCASPEYIANHGKPTTPQDLKNHNCISLLGLDQWRFQDQDKTLTIKAQGNLRIDNGEAIRDACAQGIGVTVNSAWSAYRQLLSGELIQLLPDYPIVSNTAIWAVYPSSRQLAPKVSAFIDFLSQRFAGIPYWELALTAGC